MALDGKVAVVTGAARGIGRGIALRLATHGADIAINDREENDDTVSLVREIEGLGRRAIVCPCDVSDPTAVGAMFGHIIATFGHVDIAVANAAFSIRNPVVESRWQDVLRTLEVTQFGVFHTCQQAAQHMVARGRGGKIVIISSVHAELAVPRSAAYNMAKAAVTHLGATMAANLRRIASTSTLSYQGGSIRRANAPGIPRSRYAKRASVCRGSVRNAGRHRRCGRFPGRS